MKIVIVIFLFILALLLIGQNLDKPFWGVHDWNGVRYGNIARNYLRYGLIATKLGQVENSGQVNPSEFEYYTHYPPLLPLTIGLSYKIFGVSEWSTRLIPVLATAGSVVLIFLIGLRIYNLKIGIMAALLALTTPMSLYFGKNASHEPLTLFFILVSFYGYMSSERMKSAKLFFIAGLVLAQLTAWAGYFLVPALTIIHLLRKEFNQLKNLIPYWILSIILFSIHLSYVDILTGTIAGGNLFESLFLRTGLLATAQPSGFNLPNYLNQLRLWFSTLYTLTLMLLVTFWIVIKTFNIKHHDWPIVSLGIIGIIYIILFSNSVYIHNYLIFYFLPFLGIAGALGLDALSKIMLFKRIYPILIILILVFVFLERRNFLNALNEGSPDKFAVEVGRAINRNSKPEDLVIVSPLKFSYSSDKFLRFYSDRTILYSDRDNLNYDARVIVDQQNQKFEIMNKR